MILYTTILHVIHASIVFTVALVARERAYACLSVMF